VLRIYKCNELYADLGFAHTVFRIYSQQGNPRAQSNFTVGSWMYMNKTLYLEDKILRAESHLKLVDTFISGIFQFHIICTGT
jgi:hypothetical protein